MNGKPWTQPELEYLLELAGDQPFPMLCRMYNRMAGKQGWPMRTPSGLSTAIYRYGSQRYTTGEWITINQANTMLNASDGMVRHWIKRGWITPRSYSKSIKAFHYISRTDLRRLARERPQLFAGQSEATLTAVLCDEKLAEYIATNYPRRNAVATPVIQVETGRRFPSIKAAARATYVTYQALQYALKQQKPIAGYHWQFANPKHQADLIAKVKPRSKRKSPQPAAA